MSRMLNCIVPNTLWHATQPLKFGPLVLTTRMTVVRLRSGPLWVHSPITPTAQLLDELKALGEVRFVIAPNKSHHLFFLPFLQAQPSAQGYVAVGLESKRPDLHGFAQIPLEPPWGGDLQGFFIEGLPLLNETVWFHKESGTLIVTDLLFCFSQQNQRLTSVVATLLGVNGKLGMSRTMKLAVRDRRALARSVALLLALPVQRVIVAHDQIVDDRAAQRLAQAFAWLR